MTGEREDLYEDLSEIAPMKIGTITKRLPYYAYGHFGYLYDTYKFNRAETL